LRQLAAVGMRAEALAVVPSNKKAAPPSPGAPPRRHIHLLPTQSGHHCCAWASRYAEIARANDGTPTVTPPRVTNRSVAAALRGGRTSRQVAADRDMAEGEVMLRGYLGGHAVACPCATCAEQTAPRRRAAHSG